MLEERSARPGVVFASLEEELQGSRRGRSLTRTRPERYSPAERRRIWRSQQEKSEAESPTRACAS